MLQHVSLEVPAPEGEASVEFWGLLGFERVEAPAEIGDYVRWVARAGTQVHLILTDPDSATVPALGHCAVVVDDFEAAFAALRGAGHEVEEGRRLWGARRAFAIAPGGHRVELMESPPPS
jgi:catechol 2,3-dioxygenase-like lactoylglutathione lyase family enzyme